MVQTINTKGQLHQDLMLVDRELMCDVITVDHHHTSLGDARGVARLTLMVGQAFYNTA